MQRRKTSCNTRTLLQAPARKTF